MNDDLPRVYAGTIDDSVNNTQDVFYSKGNNAEIIEEENLSVESKINRIFNSPNYVYKKEVLITTANGSEKKVIIGRTNSNLLTFDNETIPIDSINDIRIV